MTIAYWIKNFFIIVAVIFLIVGVIRLLISDNTDEDVKKWKQNIIWTSLGIFFLQIAYTFWATLFIQTGVGQISTALSWDFWNKIIAPIVSLMQYLASFAFIAMMIYAFYIMVTGG